MTPVQEGTQGCAGSMELWTASSTLELKRICRRPSQLMKAPWGDQYPLVECSAVKEDEISLSTIFVKLLSSTEARTLKTINSWQSSTSKAIYTSKELKKLSSSSAYRLEKSYNPVKCKILVLLKRVITLTFSNYL